MDSDYDPTSPAKNEKGDSPPPPPVQPHCEPVLPNAKKNQSDCGKETAKNSSPQTRAVEWWQLVVNGLLAVVGIFVLLVYSCQLDVMRGQLKNMEGQLEQMKGAGAQTDQLINKTAEQAGATSDLAKQAKLSDETLRVRDRSFVNLVPVVSFFPPENPTVVAIDISVQNLGNIPARRISLQYACPIVPPSVDPLPLAEWSGAELPFVAPKQQFPLNACNIETRKAESAIKLGMRIFALLKAEYVDSFDPAKCHITQMSLIVNLDLKRRQYSFRPNGPHNCADEDCQSKCQLSKNSPGKPN